MLNGTHRQSRQDEVVYGRPAASVVAAAANAFGAKRLGIVTSRSLSGEGGLAERLRAELGECVVSSFDGVRAHSPREDVVQGAERARDAGCDLLVALGGGSVIDATKVMQICLAGGVSSPSELDAYRASAGGRAASLDLRVRMLAVPTTLSAAEFTSFAGVTAVSRHAKEGYHHPMLVPRSVALDPDMTRDTPMSLWCSTGLKAIDHAVEQLCNPNRTPYADALAEAGLQRLARALRASKKRPEDLEARIDCQIGAWLAMSGAIAGFGIGASHAIGHTLGGLLGVPHGITSAVMLPAVLDWNESVLGDRSRLVARLMGEAGVSAAEAVRKLCRDLELPAKLEDVGVSADRFRAVAEHTMHDRGIRANPRPIHGPEDVEAILRLASR